jgi:hypothetical protein
MPSFTGQLLYNMYDRLSTMYYTIHYIHDTIRYILFSRRLETLEGVLSEGD